MPIVLAVLSAFAWGAADFTQGVLSKTRSPLSITFWSALFWVVASGAVIAITRTPLVGADFGWGVLAGLATVIAMPLFLQSLASGKMSIVAPITGTLSALLPVLVGLFAGERPPAMQLAGAGIAIVAIAMVSTVKHPGTTHANKAAMFRHLVRPDVYLGAICGIGFGLYFVMLHQTHSESGLWPVFSSDLVLFALAPVMARIAGHSLRLRRQGWERVWFGALCDWIAAIAYLLATRSGLLAIVAVVSSLYPAITVVLARIFLHDKLGKLHTASLVLAFLGVGLMASQ